jgi:hypothetical protein
MFFCLALTGIVNLNYFYFFARKKGWPFDDAHFIRNRWPSRLTWREYSRWKLQTYKRPARIPPEKIPRHLDNTLDNLPRPFWGSSKWHKNITESFSRRYVCAKGESLR